jgi:hypothetical protein
VLIGSAVCILFGVGCLEGVKLRGQCRYWGGGGALLLVARVKQPKTSAVFPLEMVADLGG